MTDPIATLSAMRSPLADKLGITLHTASEAGVTYALPFDPTNVTVADIVHGGAILSLADVAATAAVWYGVDEPQQYRGLTIDLSLSFMSAARGCTLLATGRVLRRGRSVCFCEVDVTDDKAHPVARAKVVYKLSRTGDAA